MNKFSIRLFNYKFGMDRNGWWFIQKYQDGRLKRARHTGSLMNLLFN